MAGRGVDIVLGGALMGKTAKELKRWEVEHQKVVKAGGLHVIGTERHEARRVDNQLRGRSGRQGDSGSSRFYLSLEDDLMRIFGGEQISGLMDRLKLPEDQPIENMLISKAIEQAQVKVEGFHFDVRKRLVEFDDVANQQRDIIYKMRRRVLESDDLKDEILEKLKRRLSPDTLFEIIPFDDASMKKIGKELEKLQNKDEFLEKILMDVYEKREKDLGETTMRQIEKYAFLGSIDHLWMDHIDHIDDLREGVSLRGYGQRDPLIEFKNEAYTLFENLIDRIDEELSHRIFRIGVAAPQPEIPLNLARENIDKSDNVGLSGGASEAAATGQPAFQTKKPGRNDPCPCGAINPETGKPYKYKKCGMINAPYHRG